MIKKLIKKPYLKKVITILLFIVSVFGYLSIPHNTDDLFHIKAEKLDKSITEMSLYMSEDIDFISGYNKSFKATLPFSQIIEYKKEKFINNLASYTANENEDEIPKEMKEILLSVNQYSSSRDLLGDYNNNTKYIFFQFLGVISVILILLVLYLVIKKRKPNFLNYYIFIVVLFYFTNIIFLGLKSDKEKQTEKILKESSVNNKLN
jgi:hypothetical protein